jgi:hypothetical protein
MSYRLYTGSHNPALHPDGNRALRTCRAVSFRGVSRREVVGMVLNSESRMRLVKALLCASLLVVAAPSYGATPSKFSSVPAMMSSLKDYTQESGTSKVLKREPLHIQVSPLADD